MEIDGLVLSLRDQSIEPGSQQEAEVRWTVPDGWDTEVLTLVPGSEIPLQLVVTTTDDGVAVDFSGTATLVGECVRCLDPITVEQQFAASEVFVYEDSRSPRRQQSDKTESEGDEMDKALLIERDTIDLEPALRDAILSEAPLRPVCDKDCLGICVHCGALLREVEPGHKHEFLDPRFAALEGFFSSDSESGSGR